MNTANSIFSTDTKVCLAYLQFVFFSSPSQAPDFQFRHQEEIPKTDEEIRVTAAGSVSVRFMGLGFIRWWDERLWGSKEIQQKNPPFEVNVKKPSFES